MVQASDIIKHMEVLDSLGAHVGIVDHVDGRRIKLTRRDSPDGQHHYIPLSAVARVDQHVHLGTTAAAALAMGEQTAAYAGAAKTRFPSWLPWAILGAILLIALLLARSCSGREQTPAPTADANPAATAALPVEAVALPDGRSVSLEPRSLNYELQRYLASNEATPKTFQFDKLNFDTGSAAIRPVDQPNIDALAQILAAYPKAKVKIVGYTDARGGAGSNAELGQQRADAVAASLTGKNVARDRIEAASGGEANPTDTNATAQGQFENRRTVLVVLEK